jgi:predicted nucleic acid-binding protein
LDVDAETAERYAVILNSLWKAGTPIPTNDIWIAATAMQHGLHLLTTDGHYQEVSQIIVDYFAP